MVWGNQLSQTDSPAQVFCSGAHPGAAISVLPCLVYFTSYFMP